MKSSNFLLLFAILLTLTNCEKVPPTDTTPAQTNREFYQLKTYTFDTEEQVQSTDKYLEAAYLPALKKQGIKPVGVFKLRPNEADTVKKTLLLIPYSSLAQMLVLEEELARDSTYLAAGNDYLNASHDQPPYQRLETILLQAFEDMPVMQAPDLEGPRAERIYELRSYEAATEAYYRRKVDMFNAGGEIRLFDRLAFNAVFYGEVLAGPNMPNLMYMTTFTDQASRDAHWEAFVEAPEWKEMKALPKYQHTVSHADIYFLYPTAYSDY